MSYIIMGTLAFFLFILYDINSVTLKLRPLRAAFFLGCILLAVATVGIVSSAWSEMSGYPVRIAAFSTLTVLFLLLLAYTLFIAIPFQDTYINSNKLPKTCTTGIYALSRHPGVLWFIGFYFSLWLAFSGSLLLLAAILFSLFDLVYIIVQDRWIFIKTFADYGDYKKSTPFLIPNLNSLRRCAETMRKKKVIQ